ISRLLVENLDDVLAHAETIVIGNGDQEFHKIVSCAKPEQSIIDLVRVTDHTSNGRYEGICW
ncbi:MAG: GDP-mannose dehydrogenase, partial [Candidatus Binatia bacterium]